MTVQEIASASALIKQELEPLAQKIGEGAEWTFALFVKQAYVNAFTNLLFIVPGILCFIGAHWLFKKDQRYQSDGLSVLIGVVAVGGGLLFVLLPITGIIQVVVNPEYAAIKLMIETLRGQTN